MLPPDDEPPGALTRRGCALMAAGQGAEAVALVRRTLAERPGDARVESAARTILAHGVPQWHVHMLAEAARNDAYEQAIEAAVTGDTAVLDIGTGSGLLAMMAARAGARHVYACEANGAVAETAREIVAANGFSDRVTLFSRHSSTLDRDRDLAGGVDLVVAEIFSNDVIGEGVLATMEQAMARLARPGARAVPSRASVRVALAYHDRPAPRIPRRVKGFDLSLFARHASASYPLRVGDDRLDMQSEPRDLFGFDFEAGLPFPPSRARIEIAAKGGAVNGIVQWIRLGMDGQPGYENFPGADAVSHWAAQFHPMPETIQTRPGQRVTVHADQDGERLSLWFEAR